MNAAAISRRRVPTVILTVVALATALVVAIVVRLAASQHPDGLEYVAESAGFLDAAQDSAALGGLFADYAAAGIDDAMLSNTIIGVVGCGATFLVAWLIGVLAKRRRAAED